MYIDQLNDGKIWLKYTKLISFARSLFLWYLGYIALVRRGLASMLLLFAIAILIALTKNAFLIPVLYYQSWQGLSTLIWIWYTVLDCLVGGSGSLAVIKKENNFCLLASLILEVSLSLNIIAIWQHVSQKCDIFVEICIHAHGIQT